MNKNPKTTKVGGQQYIIYNHYTDEASCILYKEELTDYCIEEFNSDDIDYLEVFKIRPSKLSISHGFQLNEG
jgi:hypothetical protein